MISARLTMLAQVERNAAATFDVWGQPAEADFQPLGDPLACFVWSNLARELVDGKKTALVEDLRGLFALGAVLAAGDELVAVTDRAGTAVHYGRLRVEGPVQFKHTHREAALERIA